VVIASWILASSAGRGNCAPDYFFLEWLENVAQHSGALTRSIRSSIAVTEKNELFSVIIPAKARDYGITRVGLSVCLFVCYHDN